MGKTLFTAVNVYVKWVQLEHFNLTLTLYIIIMVHLKVLCFILNFITVILIILSIFFIWKIHSFVESHIKYLCTGIKVIVFLTSSICWHTIFHSHHQKEILFWFQYQKQQHNKIDLKNFVSQELVMVASSLKGRLPCNTI